MRIKKIFLLFAILILDSLSYGQELTSAHLESVELYRKIKVTLFNETMSASINTKQTSTSNAASYSVFINYIAPRVEYYFKENMSLAFSLGTVFYADTNIQGTKADVSYQYYFLNKPSTTVIKSQNSIVELSSHFSPYVFGGYNSSTINFNNVNISFSGITAGVGADYYWKNIPITAELGYKMLLNSNVRTLNGINIALGIGFLF